MTRREVAAEHAAVLLEDFATLDPAFITAPSRHQAMAALPWSSQFPRVDVEAVSTMVERDRADGRCKVLSIMSFAASMVRAGGGSSGNECRLREGRFSSALVRRARPPLGARRGIERINRGKRIHVADMCLAVDCDAPLPRLTSKDALEAAMPVAPPRACALPR